MQIDSISIRHREAIVKKKKKIVELQIITTKHVKQHDCVFCVFESYTVKPYQVECIIDGLLLESTDGRWYHGAPSSASTHTHAPADRRKYAELFIRHAQLFLYPWAELSHRVYYFMKN